jgi:hypothetical protein
MRQYLIDEFRPDDFKKIKAYLDSHFSKNELEGVYWITIDPSLLTDLQAAHQTCQPFYFAVVLEPRSVACEFLVRTKNRLKCECIGYATQSQRNWFIRWIDMLLDELDIRV